MKVRQLSGYKFQVESRGHKLVVDQQAPAGDDEGMEPVELLAAALATCVTTYAHNYLHSKGLPSEGIEVDIEWSGAMRPKRLSDFHLLLKTQADLDEKTLAGLDRFVKNCTVHNTLHHSPEINISIQAQSDKRLQ